MSKIVVSWFLAFCLVHVQMNSVYAQDQNASYRQSEEPATGTMFYFEQVNVLCSGVMGSTIISQCMNPREMSYSTIAYAAGGVVYLIAELMTAGKLQDAHKQNIDDLTLSEERLKDIPKEGLETAKVTEEERLDAAKERKSWMTALSVVYGVAMALAITEAVCSKIKDMPYGAWCNAIYVETTCNANNKGISKMIAMAVSFAYMAFLKNDWGRVFGQKGDNNTLNTIMSLVFPLAVQFLTPTIAKGIKQDIPRAVIFGVQFGLTTAATVNVGNLVEKYEENVSLVSRMIEQFPAETPETVVGQGAPDSTGNTSDDKPKIEPKFRKLANMNEIGGKKRCTSLGSKPSMVGDDCSNPSEIKLASIGNIPQDLNTGLQTSVNMANKLMKGDYVGAKMDAAKLSGMSDRINAINKKLKEELNKVMKASDPKFDFDKMVAEETKKHNGLIAQAFGQSGLPTAGMLPVLGQSTETKDDKNKNESEKVSTDQTSSLASESAAPGYAPNLNELFEESSESGAAVATSEPILDSLDQYDVGEKDINKKKEESIFQYISNRYKRSYEKLFKKKNQ